MAKEWGGAGVDMNKCSWESPFYFKRAILVHFKLQAKCTTVPYAFSRENRTQFSDMSGSGILVPSETEYLTHGSHLRGMLISLYQKRLTIESQADLFS